jgi:hypothetical protein
MTYHLHLMSVGTLRSSGQRLNREQDLLDLARVQADFPGWRCWPGLARTCFAVQLQLRTGAAELTIIKASSPADLRDLLTTLTSPALARCTNQTTPTPARSHQHRCRFATDLPGQFGDSGEQPPSLPGRCRFPAASAGPRGAAIRPGTHGTGRRRGAGCRRCGRAGRRRLGHGCSG